MPIGEFTRCSNAAGKSQSQTGRASLAEVRVASSALKENTQTSAPATTDDADGFAPESDLFDRYAAGRQLKLATLMDEFTREDLAIQVGRSFESVQVEEVLREVGVKREYREFVRSDNGSEFIAQIIKEFLAENNVKAAYIETDSPWQNWQGESFNGKFRNECLRMEIFGNWREVAVVAKQWRKFYNAERPHSSLGNRTPIQFKQDWERQRKLMKISMKEKITNPMAQSLGS